MKCKIITGLLLVNLCLPALAYNFDYIPPPPGHRPGYLPMPMPPYDSHVPNPFEPRPNPYMPSINPNGPGIIWHIR